MAFSGLIASEVANLGSDTIYSLLSGTQTSGVVVSQNATPMSEGGITNFVQGDYVYRQINNAAGRTLEYDVSGVTAGITGQLQNGLRYGVTVSGVNANGAVATDIGADTIDTNGVVLGTYGRAQLGSTSLTFGTTFGRLSNKGSRDINDNLALGGVTTVKSSNDSTFFSPSIELSNVVQSGAVTFQPHMGYRLTRLNIDGYTETGGPAAATFASHTVDVSDFSIGVDMSMVYGGGILTGSAEILRRNVSDDGTSFTFLGDTGNTASAATDFTGLELGVGYDVELVTGTMNFGVSGMIGKDDASAYGLTAGYRVSF